MTRIKKDDKKSPSTTKTRASRLISLRVLILEDCASDAELVLTELRRAGFEPNWQRVETEADYLAALEQSGRDVRPYDLILADYHLPQFDGQRALRLLKERGLEIPFILVSGAVGEETAVQMMKEGAADYVLKDGMVRLGQAVIRALEEKRLRSEKRMTEEKLRQSEAELLALFSAMPDIVLVLDKTGRYLKIAPTNPNLLYKPPDELIGKTLHDIFPKDQADTFFSQIQAALETRQAVHFEYSLSIGGRILWFAASVSPMTDDAVVFVAHDVTERKRTEEFRRILSETQSRLLHTTDVLEIYQLTAEQVNALFHDGIVIATLLEETSQTLKVVAYYGLDVALQKVIDVIGIDPVKTVYSLKDMTEDELRTFRTGRLERLEGGVYALSTRRIPKPACLAVEKMLHIEGVYTIGFIWQELHFGGISILARGDISPFKEAIEMMVNQAVIAINRLRAEQSLRESEERFRRLAETTTTAIFVFQGENISYVNETCEKVSGYSKDELLSMRFWELIHPDSQEMIRQRGLARQRGERLPSRYEIKLLRKDGSERWIDYSAGTITWGRLPAVVGTAFDITERKWVEDALRESEARYHAVVELQTELIDRWLPDGTLTFVNDAYCRYYGLSREELIGQKWMKVIAKEDQGRVKEYVKRLTTSLNPANPTATEEHQEIGTDGSVRWQQWTDRALFDAQGRLAEFQSVGRDITERKRAEEDLRESETRYRALAEASQDMIFIITPQGRIDYVNQFAARYFDSKPEKLIGKQRADLFPPEVSKHQQENLRRVFQSGEPVYAEELTTFRQHGIWLGTWLVPLKANNGEVKSVMGVSRDITERKQTEEQLRKRNEDLTLINAINAAANRGESLETIVRLISEESMGVFGGMGTIPYLLTENRDRLVMQNLGLPSKMVDQIEKLIGLSIPFIEHDLRSAALFRQVLEGKQGCLITDPARLQEFVESYLHSTPFSGKIRARIKKLIPALVKLLGLKSLMIVPLLSGNEAIGALEMGSSSILTEDDLGRFESLAGQLTTAIQRKQAEDALRRSEEKYRNLYENIPDGVYRTTSNGDILEANPAIARMFGYESEEEFKRATNARDLYVQPAEREEFLRAIEKSGGLLRRELVLKRKDGTSLTLLDNMRAIKDAEGKTLYYEGVLTDITERKQAEEKIRESEQRYRDIFDGVQDAICVEAMDGRILAVNERACEMYGYEHTDFLTKTVVDLVPEGHPILTMDGEGGTLSAVPMETVNRRANGELFPIEISGRLQTINGEKVLLMVVRDITERKQTEESLRESEQRYQTLAEVSPVGIFRTDPQGQTTYVNPRWCEISGLAATEALGDGWLSAVHPEDRESLAAGWRQAAQDQSASFSEYRFIRPDGAVAWVMGQAIPEKDSVGNVVSYIGTITDITERKQAEDELRKLSRSVEQSPASVVITDTAGNIEYVNPKFTQLTGYTVEEAVGNNPRILKSGETPPEEYKRLWDTITSGGEWHGVFHNKKKNGELYWESAVISPIVNTEGMIMHFLAVKEDITERKQAEEKLRQHRVIVERLQSVTQQALFSDTLDEMLPVLCAAAAEAVGAYQASIMLIDSQGYCYRSAGHNYKFPLMPYQVRPNGVSMAVLRSGKARFISDLYQTQDTINRRLIEEGLRASACLPLGGRGEAIGVFWIHYQSPHVFDPGEQSILGTFVAQAGLIIEQLNQLEAARRRLWELESLQALSSALRKISNLQEMFETLLDTALSVFNAPHGSILLPEADGESLYFVTARGWPRKVAEQHLPIHASLSGRVFYTNASFRSSNLMQEKEFSNNVADQIGENGYAGMFAPIKDEAQTVGVIFVGCDLPRQFTREELHLLTTFSEMTGTALRRETFRAETEARLSQLEALHQIDLAISSNFDLRLTLDVFLEKAIGQLGVDAMGVLLLRPQSSALEFAAGRGLPVRMTENVRLDLGAAYAGRVALERQLIRVDDLTKDDTPLLHAIRNAGAPFRSYVGVPLIVKEEIRGVLEIFHSAPLPVDSAWARFVETLASQAAIAVDNALLFESVQRSNLELSVAYESTIEGWSRALDLRDKETEGHTQRVTELTLKLARAMGLTEEELLHIHRGALLHDIGKMGVPDSILLKPDKLSDEEWNIMCKHPALAYEMLYPIKYLRLALDIPYCHHEKWDGTGYPRGLSGVQIPLSARIFAIVDVYDALTSNRPYRAAWTKEKTLDYIKEQAGRHFDPKIVEIFFGFFT